MQLELKPEKHSDFAELLLQLRTEEDRRATKLDRMHRHFGTSRSKVTANMHSVADESPCGDPNSGVLQAYISETEKLRKQVAELKLQLGTEKPKRQRQSGAESTDRPKQDTPRAEVQEHQVARKSTAKAWFCFRCGEDGHIARMCENQIDKAAVDRKYKELKAKQDEWRSRQDLSLN